MLQTSKSLLSLHPIQDHILLILKCIYWIVCIYSLYKLCKTFQGGKENLGKPKRFFLFSN